MHCYVYKGDKKEDHFLFLDQEYNAQKPASNLPAGLISMLGELHLVVEFELDDQRELPQADAKQVLVDIAEQGFYLQMPKKDMAAEEAAYFN